MQTVYLPQPLETVYREQWRRIGADPEPWELDEARYPLEPLRRYLATGDVIADLGCGAGRVLKYLQWRGYACVGMDREPAALAALQGAPVVCGDLRAVPFQAGRFTKVLALSVLDHIPLREERLGILRQLEALLRPGGLVCVAIGHQGCFAHVVEQRVLLNNRIRRWVGRAPVERHVAGVVFHPEEFEEEVRAATQLRVIGWHFVGARMALHTYAPWLRRQALSMRDRRNDRALELNRFGEWLHRRIRRFAWAHPRMFYVLEKSREKAVDGAAC